MACVDGAFARWKPEASGRPHGLKWQLWRPSCASSTSSKLETRYPSVLFLHGAGERGTDNERQLRHARKFLEHAVEPCFVLVPQCPEGSMWIAAAWSAKRHQMSPEPAKPLALAIDGLRYFLKHEPAADAFRVHVVGFSMGGFGVWDASMRWPSMFASGVALCGGADDEKLLTIDPRHLPALWAVHGRDDSIVKPSRSRGAIRALRKAGADKQRARLTMVAAFKHAVHKIVFRSKAATRWLFSFSLRSKLSARRGAKCNIGRTSPKKRLVTPEKPAKKARHSWTADEAQRLRDGYHQHGAKWEQIRKSFNLNHLRGEQLRDKVRQWNARGCQG